MNSIFHFAQRGGILGLLVAMMAGGFSLEAKAQPNKVQNAYMFRGDQELAKAKEYIDAATVHPKTSVKGKTWLYRAWIYRDIYLSKEDKFKGLHPDPLLESTKAFKKALELGNKSQSEEATKSEYRPLADLCFQEGVNMYNEKNYPRAIKYFERCYNVKMEFEQTDTLALFNIALSADNMKDYDKAIVNYKKCAELGYQGPRPYTNMAYIYQQQENDDAALEVLGEGRKKYPNDQDLLTTEINMYLKYNRLDEALNNLNLAIENDNQNSILYYARGTIHNNKKDFENAEKDYLKAIEFDNGYADAYYNLGALYFNLGVERNDAAAELDDQDDYDAAKAEGDKYFQQSLPYLEKAHELDPSNTSTMQSLKTLYARTGQTDKYKEITEKLNN
ncbi:MAG: tetratricopeptide repeat protein [Salibacteraceae bacterium]